jgi:rod shape-determining protein MreC
MKRRHLILLAIVVVLTLVFLKLPSRTATQFKLAIGGLFLPLFGLAGSSQQVVEKAGNAIVPRKDLLKQIDQLRRENAELKVQLQRVAELERENAHLRAQVGFKQTSRLNIKLARIIARDPANWWRNVQIDLGKRDGLRVDLPVRTAEGLVGRVSEVSDTRARVVLLGDPTCPVSATVRDAQNNVVDQGVIKTPAAVLDESIVELNFLRNATAVKPGQLVVTSDEGGLFPKGIRIGQIVDVRPVDFGLVHVARVKLAVRMNLLDDVWVVMP